MLPKPTWFCIPGCLALGEGSYHRDHLGREDFLYSSSVYSCHLFLISYASVRSIPFRSFIEPIFAWKVPLESNFLEDISSLSQSTVFLYFFALLTYEGLLISPWNSLELCMKMGVSFLFSFAFPSLLFSAICKASSNNHFPFLHFFFLGDGFDHCLLYNVTKLCPYFFRHSVYQI